MTVLPLSPWIYELGNSLISSLAFCLSVILIRFFATEVYWVGVVTAYRRMRFKLGLSILAVIAGEGFYRAWTWWGSHCTATDSNCQWMVFWQFVPVTSIALEITGMLCMIRVLIPDVWGTRAWMISASVSLLWSLYWFSARDEIIAAVWSALRF